MAYLDLHDIFASPTGAAKVVPHPAAAGFAPLEWNVIALARRDPLRSLSTPGRLARAMGGLFGQETPSRLADERLEALRRLAVHAWHRGHALPQAEIDRFLATGFTVAQVETLVESVTGLRVKERRSR